MQVMVTFFILLLTAAPLGAKGDVSEFLGIDVGVTKGAGVALSSR